LASAAAAAKKAVGDCGQCQRDGSENFRRWHWTRLHAKNGRAE
jgi:hypothetical protein